MAASRRPCWLGCIPFTIHNFWPLTKEKAPRLNNAGLSYKAYSISLTLERLAELFSGCFSWPQVALTHHGCTGLIETSRSSTVKHDSHVKLPQLGQVQFKPC